MKSRINIFLGLFVFFMILSACSNNSDATLSPALYFPQLKVEPNGYAAELLTGELVLVNGCLRLNDDEGTSRLLIWPYDYSVNVEDNVVQIMDGTGQIVAQAGDKLKVGGGESPDQYAQSLVATPFPENCPGPYWLVGVVVGKVDENK